VEKNENIITRMRRAAADLLSDLLASTLVKTIAALLTLVLGVGGYAFFQSGSPAPPATPRPTELPAGPTTPEPTGPVRATQVCAWKIIGAGFVREDPDEHAAKLQITNPSGRNLIGPCAGQVSSADGLVWTPVFCARASDGIGWAVTIKLRDLGPVPTPPPSEYACQV
jgi:hypothetical protein